MHPELVYRNRFYSGNDRNKWSVKRLIETYFGVALCKGMRGTHQRPSEITDERSGSDTGTSEIACEASTEPPCREAGRYLVYCPECGRRLQIKTLRYSHICGRSFDPGERAEEQKKAADTSIIERMAQIKRRQDQKTESTQQAIRIQERSAERTAERKQRNYSNLSVV